MDCHRTPSARSALVVLAILLLLNLMAKDSNAHSGGLNAEGCHNNRKTGDFHCHGGSGTALKTPENKRKFKKTACGITGGKCEGCGCKGGPGYRSYSTGRCVGFEQMKAQCGTPPNSTLCSFENAPGSGLNKACVLGE